MNSISANAREKYFRGDHITPFWGRMIVNNLIGWANMRTILTRWEDTNEGALEHLSKQNIKAIHLFYRVQRSGDETYSFLFTKYELVTSVPGTSTENHLFEWLPVLDTEDCVEERIKCAGEVIQET